MSLFNSSRFEIGDPYYDKVSLLLHSNGANGSTSFIDETGKTITAFGNAQISTTQSKFGGSSAYFGGTGDISTLASDDFWLTGDFTIDFWMRPSVISGTYYGHCVSLIDGSGNYEVRTQVQDSKVKFLIYHTATYQVILTSVATIVVDEWTHVAAVRSGDTHIIFINGNLDNSLVKVHTIPSVSWKAMLGFITVGTSDFRYQGYIDDARITKGVARYTANFVPPRAPFPNYISSKDPYYSNTSLLLNCNGNNDSTVFTDTSITPKTVTAFGNAKISTTQSKFGGSSAYFDGTGDYLQLANNANFAFGSGDFTAEAWVYTTTLTGNAAVMGYASGTSSASVVEFRMLRTGSTWQFDTGVGSVEYGVGFGTVAINTLYHVAFCRYGTNLYSFIDGVLSSTTAVSTLSLNDPASSTLQIGQSGGGYPWTGYIDDIRITKGVARYTQNFTPPTKQFPLNFDDFGSSVMLRSSFENNIIDDSRFNRTLTLVGSPTTSSTQSKFGSKSFYGGASGTNYFKLSTGHGLNLTGDLTVECFVYFETLGTVRSILEMQRQSGGFPGLRMTMEAANYIAVSFCGGDYNYNFTSVTSGVWHHIAITRRNNVYQGYFNGVRAFIQASAGQNQTTTGDWTFGYAATVGAASNGMYIDGLRITYAARYPTGTTITPPDGPYILYPL